MSRQQMTEQEEGYDELTETLIGRLRDGDTEAGMLLDRLYRDALRRFCRGYLDRIDEAEDAVQEVMYRVLKADQVPDNFRAWLYRIARHHCIDMLRRRHRRSDDEGLPPSSALDAQLTGQLSRMVKQEDREGLPGVLDGLSPEQREVLWLRYTEGLSRSEIAEVVQLPESIVKSRLFEGMSRLRGPQEETEN
ncbi:MAG: RNA polymerase sigma factor [Planctomycetota bacterium]